MTLEQIEKRVLLRTGERSNGEQKQSTTSTYDRCIKPHRMSTHQRVSRRRPRLKKKKKRLCSPRTPPRALVLPARVRRASPAFLPLTRLLSPREEQCTAPAVRPKLAKKKQNKQTKKAANHGHKSDSERFCLAVLSGVARGGGGQQKNARREKIEEKQTNCGGRVEQRRSAVTPNITEHG